DREDAGSGHQSSLEAERIAVELAEGGVVKNQELVPSGGLKRPCRAPCLLVTDVVLNPADEDVARDGSATARRAPGHRQPVADLPPQHLGKEAGFVLAWEDGHAREAQLWLPGQPDDVA